jgi:hypothetical protein
MKFLIALAILISLVSPAVAQDSVDPLSERSGLKRVSSNRKTKVFEVSKVGKDKSRLLSIFSDVQKYEAGGDAPSEKFHVLQRLSPKYLLVHPMCWRYSVASGSAYQVPNRDKTYGLVTSNPKNVVDGETVEVNASEETDEIYEYTSTSGAKRSVRIIKEQGKQDKKVLAKDEFVKKLREGETWLLPGGIQQKCGDCFGDGELSSMQKYAQCKSCKGTGSVAVDYLVKW